MRIGTLLVCKIFLVYIIRKRPLHYPGAVAFTDLLRGIRRTGIDYYHFVSNRFYAFQAAADIPLFVKSNNYYRQFYRHHFYEPELKEKQISGFLTKISTYLQPSPNLTCSSLL